MAREIGECPSPIGICPRSLFALPRGEGLPLALAEAAAAGRPIVTTDTPGCREVVVDGVNGFLVPVGDSAQLADRVAQLLADRELRCRMGQAGRERAVNNLSTEKICDQTLKLYRRCQRVENR